MGKMITTTTLSPVMEAKMNEIMEVIKMEYQIRDGNSGEVVDRNLSYQAALMYVDSAVDKYYIMELMKEDDQN